MKDYRNIQKLIDAKAIKVDTSKYLINEMLTYHWNRNSSTTLADVMGNTGNFIDAAVRRLMDKGWAYSTYIPSVCTDTIYCPYII